MSLASRGLTPELRDYLLRVGVREPELLLRLREETATMTMANMQISPEQGALMQMLVQLCGARRCLEVGVFTGYSALAVALALPEEGRLVACDVNEQWTTIARRYWQEAGVAHKIDLRLAPAAQTLAQLIEQGEGGQFDFAFIDADKVGYETYYQQVLQLLRPGGLVAVDNVLWEGAVIDPGANDEDTAAIRAFNERRRDDPQVEICMVPISDGLSLLRKL